MACLLIVEDQPTTRSALAKLLRKKGYEIHTAADAYEAMALAKKLHPDLVLLDVMIPPMDGLTFLMLLRDDPWGREMPVIVLSGLNDRNTLQRARELGVKAHLVKGEYTPEQLFEAIAEHLSQTRREPSGAHPYPQRPGPEASGGSPP